MLVVALLLTLSAQDPATLVMDPDLVHVQAMPAAVPQPPTDNQLAQAAGQVVTETQALGWLAGLVALVRLLVSLLRWAPLDRWLAARGWKRWKPHAAVLLGGLGGLGTALLAGQPIGQAVAAGVMAGLAAVGTYEVRGQGRRKKAGTTTAP